VTEYIWSADLLLWR